MMLIGCSCLAMEVGFKLNHVNALCSSVIALFDFYSICTVLILAL